MNAAIIIGVVASSIMSGTSLLYATLGEIVGERSGVVNLGLEGIMLIGASTGFAATAVTGNPYLGVAAAAISGAAVNMIFAYLVVGRGANQLATGLTLMFFCFGLSAMIGRPFVGTLITGLPRLPLFGLGSGAAAARLLSYDLLVYLAAPVALTVWWLLYRTRWGLALRTTGESPAVAFAAGLRPERLRYQALVLAGLLGGIAGAHISVALTLTWAEGMTAGRGFIAIALVIFAKWDPLWAIAGALLFGGAEGLHHEHVALSAHLAGARRLGLEPADGRPGGTRPKLCRRGIGRADAQAQRRGAAAGQRRRPWHDFRHRQPPAWRSPPCSRPVRHRRRTAR